VTSPLRQNFKENDRIKVREVKQQISRQFIRNIELDTPEGQISACKIIEQLNEKRKMIYG
jgi:hypothetical protein